MAKTAFNQFLSAVKDYTYPNRIIRHMPLRPSILTPPSIFTPIADTDPGDIFIAGYPKSGNTWMQNLIAGILLGADIRNLPDSIVQAIVPDEHAQQYYQRHFSPTFFKTHNLPQQRYRRVIHLLRDGRDAMVSYFHYRSALDKTAPDLLDMVTTGKALFPTKWHVHTEAWLSNPYDAEIITVTYEALKANTAEELERICSFAGLSRDRSFLENLSRSGTFEEMKNKERRMGWANPEIRGKDFIRRGKIGSYKDEMPPSVQEAFLKDAGPTMQRVGYSCN